MVRFRSESGQASVEAVAVVPALILAALIGWQLVLVGPDALAVRRGGAGGGAG